MWLHESHPITFLLESLPALSLVHVITPQNPLTPFLSQKLTPLPNQHGTTRTYNFFFFQTPTISIPNFHNHSLSYYSNSTIKFFNWCFRFHHLLLLLILLLRYWALLLHHHSLIYAMASSLLLPLRILPLAFLLILSPFASALLSAPETNTPYPNAFSDLKESIVKVLGLTADDFKITGFDPRDAEVGHSVQYEFDVEIDRKVIPFKLLEDVNRWDYVDLPIFRVEEPGQENGLVQKRDSGNGLPVLAPFQLAGPMELWIQDAKDMRLSLPHDVDAGVLKKVILADGAVVTVKGARSVSLRQPLDLPLPLNLSQNGFAAGLLTLAEQLRHTARTQGAPLLSLRIVGPTSLASPSSTSASSNTRLKLKRLAPGLVELSSPSNTKTVETLLTTDPRDEAPTLLTPSQFTTLWPLASLNGSNANLLGFEKLLASVLGPKANKKGSFRLLKADVSAQTFVKIGFQAEKKLKEGDGVSWEGFPEWRTKPETVNMHFEVLAKVDGDKVIAESIMPVKPVIVEDTVASNVLTGNVSMSKIPIVHPPPNYFTL